MTWHDTTRRRFVTTAGLAGAALAGTGVAAGRRRSGGNRNFRTHLSGDEEVPPVDTDAQGQAGFQLNRAGDELQYKLVVANIEDVVASHIHCAPAGANGPVGVTLFGGGPTSDPGTLAEGAITEPDDGNGCGWETLADVVEAMENGETYVNVHTVANPPGEIRGQIR
jgi:hypothetical protein